MYKYILFDLDGTLADSKDGIISSFAHALDYYNIKLDKSSDLNKFIGPPVYNTFIKYFNFSGEKAREATKIFREHHGKIGLYQNKLYENVDKMLKSLYEGGNIIAFATCKQQ